VAAAFEEVTMALPKLPWRAASLLLLSVAAVGCVLATAMLTLGPWPEITLPVALLTFVAVGVLITAKRPNRIGWIFLWAGLVGELGLLAERYAAYGLAHGAMPLPGTEVTAWVAAWTPPLALLPLLTFGFLLFPDGRLPSRSWLPVAWVSALGTVLLCLLTAFLPGSLPGRFSTVPNPFGADPAYRGLFDVLATGTFLLLLGSIVASATAMALRLRRARADERQQLKWYAFAAVLVTSAIVGSGLLSWLANIELGDVYHGVVLVTLPVAAAIAILRYRLYDIDHIVSRTVSYALLSAVLAGVYVGSVVFLGRVLAPVGARSDLAVAAATLAAAAVFAPARRRIQRLVDRRFNRARYDAEQVMLRFREQLRDERNLEDVVVVTQDAVVRTIEPVGVSLWLRSGVTPYRLQTEEQ
jgi:hypothetical protein